MIMLNNSNSLIIVGVKRRIGATKWCRKYRNRRAGKSLVRRPWGALAWNKCCHAFTEQNDWAMKWILQRVMSFHIQMKMFQKIYLFGLIWTLCNTIKTSYIVLVCIDFKFLCYLPSWFPLSKPSIQFPLPLLLWGGFPTHPLPPHHPSIHLHWSIEPPQNQGPPLPLMPDKAIVFYIWGWSHGTGHVHSLVGGLVPGSSGVLVGWCCCSSYGVAKPFSSLSPSANFSNGVPMLRWMVDCKHPHLYLYWPGSGRASQRTPVIKCFLASAIVSEFGVCRWDGSLGSSVSGWPFLLSLLHSLSLHFFREEQFCVNIFEMGGWPHSSMGGGHA
jgi:hypothetical protein